MNSLGSYVVVNIFGGQIPEGFDINPDPVDKLLRVHDMHGLVGLDLATFTKIQLTGNGSEITFQGVVPTNASGSPLALLVDDGCTMLIRASVNRGVTLADYAITKLNNGTGEVVIGEAPFVGSADIVLDVDFENGDASDASGLGNNGVVTGNPVYVEGIDGGKAIYIHNAFGKNGTPATEYVTFADLKGLDISKDDYTISFWYRTVNGGTTDWAASGKATTAGADINMNKVKLGGVVFSNQDVVADGAGFSAVQLPQDQFFALGITDASGAHYDKDGVRTPVDDTWHMITITYDRAGYYTVYVDGNPEAKKSIDTISGETLGVNTLVLGADINGQFGLENTYILGIVVLVCLGIVIEQEYKIYQLKQEKAATEARIDALNEKQAKLEAERKKLDDPKYLEKLAREDYNMVGKNEVPLFIVDEKKAAQEPK